MSLIGDHLATLLPGLDDLADPAPIYERLLALPEPPRSPDGDAVLLVRYGDVNEMLLHPSARADRGTSQKSPRPTAQMLFSLDPPAHTRIRRLVSRAFTPRRVSELEPWFRARVNDAFDRVDAAGRMDVVGDLALPLPIAAISQMLGIPHDDRDQFAAWTRILARDFDDVLRVLSREQQLERRRALRDFRAYITDLAAQRRAEPTDDLFTDLVQAEEDGDRLSNQELVRNVQLLLAAGHETTASSLASGVLELAERPEVRSLVATDPDYARGFFEEILRLHTPVQMTLRFAGEDMAIGGHPIGAGTIVLLCMAAANLDARQFENPHRLDPLRPNASRHLAFVSGIHYCLGQALARMEGRVVMSVFSQRVEEPRVDRAGLTFRPSVIMRQMDFFPLEFAAMRGASEPAAAS